MDWISHPDQLPFVFNKKVWKNIDWKPCLAQLNILLLRFYVKSFQMMRTLTSTYQQMILALMILFTQS